jgi:hypothetical protein
MAKAKKSESTASGTSAAGAKKKPAKSKSPPAAPAGGPPLIDTNLAAASAAKFVAAKVAAPTSGATTSSAPTAPKESSAFKNLKESLAKPASAAMANFLDKTGGPSQKKQNLPLHGGKQVGRNQTFGADVNRAGVPRRTPG